MNQNSKNNASFELKFIHEKMSQAVSYFSILRTFSKSFQIDETSSYASLPTPPPPKVLLSITFSKRNDQSEEGLDLYDVRHNFSDDTSLISIHAGDNFEAYRPPSNLVAILQDNQLVTGIPTSFLNWITFSE